MKKIIIAIMSVLFVFIITTVSVSMLIINGTEILKNFEIISVENISNKYTIKFERVKAAKYYDVIIYNTDDNTIFYSQSVDSTTNTITLDNISYNDTYKLIVYAYDEVGDSIAVKNPYTFTYTDPTFSEDNDLVLNNDEDYDLLIDGNLENKDYTIKLMDNNYVIKTDKLTSNEYTISKSLYQDMEEQLDIQLLEGNTVIDTISLYNKLSPVGDLTITSPVNGTTLDYNDVTFTYEGGDNATDYVLQIYKGDNLIKEKTISKNRCVISSDFFNKAQTYTIKINAVYNDYTDLEKSAEVEFTMNEKDTLKPAYINSYYKYVASGTNITLNNPNSDGTIYYTIDGSDPGTNGIEYTSPITVNEKMTLKTIIKADNKNNSIISTFDINVGTKDNYVVYLSPSNQSGNIGVASVGYTNEMEEMNDLSDYIESELEKYGVKVYRNDPDGNINLWNSESKYYGADLHLAIHSNASTTHTVYGIETWIDEQSSTTYSLANLIQNALMSIYYQEDGNRGVKYANGSLGEVNENYVPFGILVEVAHHDYTNDAQWIMVNKRLIGTTIADTVLKYFQIIE